MTNDRKIVFNFILISLVLALFVSSAFFATAYDSPSSTASTSIAYTYSKSFQTSKSQNLTFSYSLKPIYNALVINASPSVSNSQNPFILKFVDNNSEVQLTRDTNTVGNFTYNYFWSYFTPDASNDNIQIIAVKGFSLNVNLTITGYNNLANKQEIQAQNDASNSKSSPTIYSISSNTVFYGILSNSDLADYFQFNFPTTINVTIEVSVVQPISDYLGIYTKYNSIALDYQFDPSHPVNKSLTINTIAIGVTVPAQIYKYSPSSVYIYKITILSTSFPKNKSHSLNGFEFMIIPSILVLPLLKKKRRKN